MCCSDLFWKACQPQPMLGLQGVDHPMHILGTKRQKEYISRCNGFTALLLSIIELFFREGLRTENRISSPVPDEDIRRVDDFLVPGHGRLNPPRLEAIRMTGNLEVAIHRTRNSRPGRLFLPIHTGGTPAMRCLERRST